MRERPLLLLALTLAGAIASAASAATIYRWVDENGRTHISDAVPEQYKTRAVRTDSRMADIPAEREFDAQRRLAQQKARLDAAAQGREREAARVPPGAALAQRRPAEAPASDCATLRRLYRESQECFAPFKNANGSTKAEGYGKCAELENPSFKCGIPTSAQ